MNIADFFLGLFTSLRSIGVKRITYNDQILTNSLSLSLIEGKKLGFKYNFPIEAIDIIAYEGLESLAKYGIISHPNPTYKKLSLDEKLRSKESGDYYLSNLFDKENADIFKKLAVTFVESISV